MRRWTEIDLDKAKARILRGLPLPLKAVPQKAAMTTKVKKSPGKELNHIEAVLREYFFNPERECTFTELRKFRADLMVHELKLIIEYEGLMSAKSRHTTITGYSGDSEKYNLASAKGYKIFRYTALTYKNIELDLLRLLFHAKYLQ